MLKHLLRQMGVEDERLRLVWASAAEGQQLAEAVDEMVDQVRRLGPLNWRENWREDADRDDALESIVKERAELMEVQA
jgi:F420-non-reducing hydrogenase iron-sulfur subunit